MAKMKESVDYKNVIDGLHAAIYNLTWLGKFWGWTGVIALHEIRHRHFQDFSALSSTYYAASGNAKARAKNNPLWIIIAAVCFWRALRLSDRFAKMVTLKNMTVGQLDVRSHILRKAGRHEEALKCVDEALFREDIERHSKALLLIGAAESLEVTGKKDEAHKMYTKALFMSQRDDMPVDTTIRVLRSVAKFERRQYRNIAEYKGDEKLFRRAYELALENNLNDQRDKIVSESGLIFSQ